MIKPIINPASEKTLIATISDLPQSILLTGDFGIGLATISKFITDFHKASPIFILPEKDEKIDLDKGIISVDIMRRLYDEARTKTTNKRIFVIDYAERMTHQAQNAFLKLLEEPGKNIHFILASHNANTLLPTILSRVTSINLKPITARQSQEFIDYLGVNDATKKSQLMFIAGGLPAEIHRLINNDTYFNERSEIIRDARELLRAESYQKLKIAQKYKDSREKTLILLNDMANILKKSVVSSPQIEAINRIDHILETISKIEANGNIRLCLANLVI